MIEHKDVVVTEGGGPCGAVVYWTLSGEFDVDALARAWAAEGLDPTHLPAPTSPERALRRAVDELRDRAHMVRRLPDGSGYAVVAEHQHAAKFNHYEQSLVAYLDAGQLVVEPAGHPDAERVIDAYERALSRFDGGDASGILIGACRRLRAVSLRTMGGIYFVPQPAMPELERVTRALEACSANRVWRLPAMRSEDAARAVLAAVSEEVEAEAARMEEELAREGDDALGERALGTRAERAATLRRKTDEYERLLGASLGDARDRLERVQAALAAAALAVVAAEAA